MATTNIEKLRETMPWNYVTSPLGVVTVLDKNGKQVDMFDFLNFTCSVSQKMAK